jgi:predicted phage baseplate assembly protein
MAGTTEVKVPSFNWTAFYYGQILEALIQFKRTNVPELTNESTEEPLIQMLRAFACVGHLNNVTADEIAKECTLPTAKLIETVRNMLRLIGYEMSPATPAIVDILLQLSQTLSSTVEVVPALSQVSTRREGATAAIPFRFLDAIECERTDQISSVLAWDDSTSTFTDYTAKANDPSPGQEFTPWAVPAAKDCLYVGHRSIEWDKLAVALDTAGAGLTGVWEYYDGQPLDTKPDAVTKPGAYLRFDLNGLLGTGDRSGTLVRVQFDATGVYLDLVSDFDGTNYIETDGSASPYLGQADPPSTDEADYTVGSLWKELPDLDDGTVTGGSDLAQSGDVSYSVPEDTDDEWEPITIQGVTAYWLRYRIVSVATPTAPIFDGLQIHMGKQYVKGMAVQGQYQVDSPLATSDGSASQVYAFSKEYFIWASETITVDTVPWLRVTNFLQSKPTDRHYIIQLGENDRASVKFGDGIRGAKPTAGAIVAASYRYGANLNGTVGANTVIVDSSGIPYVSRLWNPRASRGWQQSQGANEQSLELAKEQGPASLRTFETALGPDDVEYMATNRFTDDNGVKLFTRALVIEGSYGPKTMELVSVVAGGGIADSDQLRAVELYFNGNRYTYPYTRKRLVGNQEVVATNYRPRVVDISADVYGDTTPAIVISRLTALLQPEARQEDGGSWEWDFGENIRISRMIHEIFKSDTDIYGVQNLLINGAAADLVLALRELPVAGTLAITVNP